MCVHVQVCECMCVFPFSVEDVNSKSQVHYLSSLSWPIVPAALRNLVFSLLR